MQRLLTALVFVPLVAAAIFWLPGVWFLLFAILVVELAAIELVRLARAWAPDAPLSALIVLVPAASLALAWCLQPTTLGLDPALLGSIVPLVVAVIAPLIVLLGRTPVEQSLPAIGCLAFGTAYLALPAVCFWRLRQIDPWLLVLLVTMIAIGDTCAYYVGSTLGRRKLSPVVSPNKTWEGSIASFLGGMAVASIWSLWRFDELAPWLLALGAVTIVAAQCGDLVESMLKRGAGIKDSGKLLPGHGGVLDRSDAYLFAAPIFLLGLALLGFETPVP